MIYLNARRIIYTVLSPIILGCFCLTAQAQDGQRTRGFYPGASYAVGDIDTINTQNGNLILNVQLASLPAGRAGLSAGIGLHYDSKVFDTLSYSESRYPEGPDTVNLTRSRDGGWRYGFQYELQAVNRYDNYQPQGCNPTDTMRLYAWKVRMKFPDGNVHIFRPVGYNDPYADDFFRIRPDGWQANGCAVDGYAHSNTMKYYSIDGTFVRLEVQHDSDDDPVNNPWTLYLADGGRVTGGGVADQRIYDRNNNYVEIQNITYNSHPASKIVDQMNRSLILEYGPTDEDYLYAWRNNENGQLTELKWTIKWGGSGGGGGYFGNPNDLGTGGGLFYAPSMRSVTEIDLPTESGGLSYKFGYQGTAAEVDSVTLPSGAKTIYTYASQTYDFLYTDFLTRYVTQKDRIYRPEYDISGGVSNTPCDPQTETCITDTWHYTYELTNHTIAHTIGPDGGDHKDHFIGNPPGLDGNPIFNPVYRSEHPDGTMVETMWQSNYPYGCNLSRPGINPYLKTEFTSIKNAAGNYTKTKIKSFSQDKNGNSTVVTEYDWVDYNTVPHNLYGQVTGIPSGAVVKRVTTSSYYNSTPDAADNSTDSANTYHKSTSPQFRGAMKSSEIGANGSTAFSRTEYTYDNASTTANLTQQTSWDSTKGAYSNPLSGGNSISTSNQYDSYGNVILSTDARGIQTSSTYGDVNGYSGLYPTQVVASSNYPSIARTATNQYDFYSGLVTRSTDVDNNVSTASTYDVFGRAILVKSGEGKPEETRISTDYSDVNRRIITRADMTNIGDGKLVEIDHFDQLGRIRLSRQLEDAATQSATDETLGMKVQTRYAYSGANSYSLVSNSYRTAYSYQPTDATMGWTRTKSDSGGKLVEEQTFGGAGLPSPWGSNATTTGTLATAYDANLTIVTDQEGKVRRSLTDALGQLARVDEPDSSGNLDTNGVPVQSTNYTYNVLGNLTQVVQGNQTRTFTYSSLGRLLSAINPESNTVSYQYDDEGNLTQKTDARGVISTYAYDGLNRNYSVTRTNDPANTPAITRSYDGATNGKGRLWKTETSGATGTRITIDSYDPLGRMLSQSTQFNTSGGWSSNYTTQASYDRASHVVTETYPSNRTVTHTFDGAGRELSASGTLGDGTSRAYTTSITYDAASRLKQEQFGTTTPIYNKLYYNSRGQLAEIRESSSANNTTWNRGAIINHYSNQCWGMCAGAAMPDNNGNLKKQDHYIPDNEQVSSHQIYTQQYAYDSLNRLQGMTDGKAVNFGTLVESFRQAYTYDRFGNRSINQAGTTQGVGINSTQAAVVPNTTTNRMYAPGETETNHPLINYDNAGNQIKDYYTESTHYDRVYDAENHLVSSVATDTFGGSQTSTYAYDGNGARLRRTVAGTETWQVYGLGGELVAEYAASGSTSSPQKEYGYRNGQVLVTAEPSTGTGGTGSRTNYALAANGGVATASSELSSAFPAISTNNGDRKGLNWESGGGWRDAAPNYTFPDWLQIDFSGSKSIDEIDVFTIQDSYASPSEPTEAMTFSLYGQTGYDVQYWNGSAWTTVSGGSITGNNKVWRKITFTAVTTTKVRVLANAAADGYSRLAEVEAWGAAEAVPRTNVALSSNGGVATASSELSSAFPAISTNNGDRKGLNWESGGGWRDAAPNYTFPDWLQIDFSGSKTIDEIDVFTIQDSYASPSEPTEAMTFSLYGQTGYDVQYWNGSAWTTVSGGSITGNNKVWRKINFTAVTTTKIRVLANAAADGYSRLIEIEAWTATSGGSSGAKINWLVTDQLGTPRMVLDQSGSLVNMKRHDYLPFGEELFDNIGGRATTQGFDVADGVRQKFTSKERDDETKLDYFLARYYSSKQGRFTSPDEFKGGPDELFENVDPHDPVFYADLTEPQSLNKYQYCLNNPLRYVDPDGHQTKASDRLKDAAYTVADFGGGVIRGISSSLTFGLFGAPQVTDSRANRAGQVVGSVIEGASGVALAGGGGGGLTIGTGGAALVTGVPEAAAVTGGVMVVGSVKNLVLIGATPIQNRNNSDRGSGQSQQSNEKPSSPGQTSAGKPTDQHGRPLGPSGKPTIHQKTFPTKKAAKDAARNAGRGAPMQHPSPRRGQPHFHPTKGGKKVQDGTHYNYPR